MFRPTARACVDSLVAGGSCGAVRTGGTGLGMIARPTTCPSVARTPSWPLPKAPHRRILGTIDASAAHTQVHTGAVHVHQGRTHVVTELDLETATATVMPGDPGGPHMPSRTATFNCWEPNAAPPSAPWGSTSARCG